MAALQRLILCSALLALNTCAYDETSAPSHNRASLLGDASKNSVTATVDEITAEQLLSANKLSLNSCLQFGLQENLDIRIAEAGTASTAAGIDIAKAEFDPFIYGSWSKEYQIDGAEFEEKEGGIRVRTITGTTISLEGSSASDVFVDSTFDSGFPNGFTSAQPGSPTAASEIDSFIDALSEEEVTLRIRQRLLRGNSIKANRAGIDLARLAVDAASTTERAQALEFLRGAETGYWAAAIAREIYFHEEQSLERNRRILEDVKLRQDAGAATVLDVLEAEAGYSETQETTMRAMRRYEDALDNLWFILGLPLTAKEKAVDFEPVDPYFPGDLKPDPEESYSRALNSFPDVLLVANTMRQNQVRLGVAKNNLLPALDVEVTGRYIPKEQFDPEEIERDYDWGVLLQLSIPWTFRAERAELRRAKADLEQSQIARERAERSLKRDILVAARAVEFNQKQLEVAEQGAIVNEKKWIEQELRFREGLVPVRELIEAQEETKSARTRELEARLRVIAAWKFLQQLDGSILNTQGFTWD